MKQRFNGRLPFESITQANHEPLWPSEALPNNVVPEIARSHYNWLGGRAGRSQMAKYTTEILIAGGRGEM